MLREVYCMLSCSLCIVVVQCYYYSCVCVCVCVCTGIASVPVSESITSRLTITMNLWELFAARGVRTV
jgi:hypothetical protein